MAKYQLGEQGHVLPRGEYLEAYSEQTFPDDYEPSLKWVPLDKAAEDALDKLVAKKKATHQQRIADASRPAPTEFKRLPRSAALKEAPQPESRPDPNTMAGHAKAHEAKVKGSHLRGADKDVL